MSLLLLFIYRLVSHSESVIWVFLSHERWNDTFYFFLPSGCLNRLRSLIVYPLSLYCTAPRDLTLASGRCPSLFVRFKCVLGFFLALIVPGGRQCNTYYYSSLLEGVWDCNGYTFYGWTLCLWFVLIFPGFGTGSWGLCLPHFIR